jgi:hypothetical protein
MFHSLKTGFLTIVLSAIALVAIAQQTRQIDVGASEASTISTGGGAMSAPEANVDGLSVDEQRIDQLSQGSEDAFARGICSIDCRPCTSNSQCQPFDGQPQTCVFGQFCP